MDGIILSDLRFDIVLKIQQLNRYIKIVTGSSEKTLYTSCKYMESPAILLKSAAYESNPTIRTDKVVKACRIITDILPYDKDSQSLIDEPELMKYLMVTLPLNPRAIDLIITTMIDKFKRVTVFLKETWQGFLQIASMEEENNSPRKKDNDPWKVLQLGIRSLIKLKSTTTMKDLDDMTPSMRQQKYNDVITGKKAVLKETVLDYVDKFLMIYIKELKEVTSFKPNISELTKKFTTFSVSENVVKKTYALIDKIKAIDPDLITEPEPEAGPSSRKDTLSRLGTSLSNFGEEPKDTKSKVGSLSKVGSEQTTTPVPSKPIISLKGKSLLQKIIEKKQKGSLEEVEEDDKSSDENKTEGEEDDDDDDEDDSGLNGNENDIGSPELEQWMAEYKISDAPIIYRSEFAKEFIQEETNFDILFSYLFDPRRTSISECWKIKHPNMSSVVVEDKDKPVPATPVHKEALGIFKLKDYKQLHPYVLRSYKVMQLFCDDRNYRDMIQAFPLVIGRFFQELHRNMTTKTDLMCNLNHIVAVIEYFVIKEPKLCVSYILHHNLVYKFFQNTELSSTQRLILLLFNCALNNQELEKDLQWKVLEYCRITSLFVDASSVILNGTNTFPLDKFKVEYKPPGITNVVDLANESLEPHDFKISKSNSVEDKTNSRLVEETKGFIIDIDDIKGFLQQPKNIDKKELISKNDSFVRTASKLNIKRYPSLMQKNFYENSISGSESYRSALGVQTERTVLPPLENTAMSKRNSQAKVDPSDFGLETLSNKNKVLAVDIPASNIKKLAQTATPTKKPSALPLLPLKNIHSVSPATTKNQSTPGKPVAVRINVTQSAGKEPIFLGARKADTERIREKVLESGKVAQPKVVIPDTPEPIAKQKAAAAVSQTKLNSERSEYAPPEKKNLLREFDLDVLGKAELEHLNELYPTSTRNMVLTPLDKEAKKPEYKMKYIQANDQFALSLCELFNTLFQKMLMNAKTLLPLAIPACVHVDDELKQIYFKKRKLGYLPVDHGTFWKAVFVDQCTFVKNLLQNYLIKIKIHHFEEMNSGYVSGMIINSLLSNCSTNEFIKPYGKIIQNICRDNFLFLCKTLIQSYAWINRPELKVYLQDYEVNEPLGSGRIILAKTLDLIIQNDAENSFTIISQINDTCWSTLITWFLNKKSNNLYHQTFYSIMENTLLYTNEKTVLTILFKLNLLSSLYKIWNEIYQNGVLLKEKHVESMYYYLKRFTELIDQITKKHENYSVFISQLACSVSWSSLKAKFLTKPKVKKVTDKSKQKPRLPGVPSRVPSRAGSRVDIPGTASSMTRSRILADYSSQKGIDSPRGEKRIPTKERLF